MGLETNLRAPFTGNLTAPEISITSAPAEEPVELSDLKDYMKIDFSSEDDLLTAMITSIRRRCEAYANLSFITQTITAEWQQYAYKVPLPRGPIQSITSVTDKYQDEETAFTEGDEYFVLGQDFKTLNMSTIYQTYGQYSHRLIVVYVAGYGDAADVPEEIKEAIKMTAAHNYENRGFEQVPIIPLAAKQLLANVPGAQTLRL